MKVYIEENVVDYFKKVYLSKLAVETGGLLLGFKDLNKYIVFDYIEVNQFSNEYSICFDYGLCKTEYLNKVKSRSCIFDIIGVWHTHVGECFNLSTQDINSLKQISELTQQSILSVLFNNCDRFHLKVADYSKNKLEEISKITIFEMEKEYENKIQ